MEQYLCDDEGGEEPARWERLSSEHGQDYAMFNTRHDRSRSPGSDSIDRFDIVESADGVAVIALTPQGELVLVQQFRHARRELSIEVPSGIVDPGESPVEAAERELHEETGYRGHSAELLGTLVLNPSWQTTRVHMVLMRDAKPEGEKDLDDTEETRVCVAPIDAVRNAMLRGTITAAVSVSALALFDWSRR